MNNQSKRRFVILLSEPHERKYEIGNDIQIKILSDPERPEHIQLFESQEAAEFKTIEIQKQYPNYLLKIGAIEEDSITILSTQ